MNLLNLLRRTQPNGAQKPEASRGDELRTEPLTMSKVAWAKLEYIALRERTTPGEMVGLLLTLDEAVMKETAGCR